MTITLQILSPWQSCYCRGWDRKWHCLVFINLLQIPIIFNSITSHKHEWCDILIVNCCYFSVLLISSFQLNNYTSNNWQPTKRIVNIIQQILGSLAWHYQVQNKLESYKCSARRWRTGFVFLQLFKISETICVHLIIVCIKISFTTCQSWKQLCNHQNLSDSTTFTTSLTTILTTILTNNLHKLKFNPAWHKIFFGGLDIGRGLKEPPLENTHLFCWCQTVTNCARIPKM